MNFGFSGEMIFIFFLALILFGPKKLPEIGRRIGRIMNEFRRASNEFRSQIETEINVLEAQKPQILPPLQAPLGSLASRIFNPPPAEQMRAAGTRAPETQAAGAATGETRPAAAPENAAVETGLAPSPAPKVAPDA
ncbi:MAG: twin-arginine translocase TatA/TatE family subunit [Terriglobales bacterium]